MPFTAEDLQALARNADAAETLTKREGRAYLQRIGIMNDQGQLASQFSEKAANGKVARSARLSPKSNRSGALGAGVARVRRKAP